MIAKRKAIDLVNKFGKNYAVLCVNKIITAYNRELGYWKEVKQEIEKL